MDSGTGRKRPCEPDRPIDPHSKRRLSPTAAGERLAPLLPRHAGFYAPEGEPPSPPGRRLPPLYTPTCTASAERLTLGALAPSSPDASPPGLDRTRPRTQSLFDVLLQHPERDQEGQSGPGKSISSFIGVMGIMRGISSGSTGAADRRLPALSGTRYVCM